MRTAGDIDALSIIIPSYNSERTIGAALTGIQHQIRKDIVREVIVVDSSDDQKTKEIISRHLSERDRLISPGVRVMPAAGRNIGAEYATADILVFLDSDVRPAPDWAAKILEAWNKGCRVGGGSVSLPEFQKRKPIPVAQYFLQFNEFTDRERPGSKKFIPSCNLFCSRELFHETGGFPLIRTAEDVLFGLKVGRILPVWFIPEVKIDHIFREDLKGFLRNQFILGRGNIQYRRLEHPRTFYYKGLWPMLFLPAFTAIKLAKILFRVLKTGPRATLLFFFAFPAFLPGLLLWAAGFARGVFIHED